MRNEKDPGPPMLLNRFQKKYIFLIFTLVF